MSKAAKAIIDVQGTSITVLNLAIDDYICLTDIAKHKEPDRADHVIQNWMRNRNTIEFLGVWERLNNADFNPLEFEGFRTKAGLNSFALTSKQRESAHNADFGHGGFATIRGRVSAPKARLYPSLGQRPRNVIKHPIRAESPPQ